ncbi:MAG: arginyltransferase [Alphaproteobacteria bacterium]|nr:arginyltransferase [Alphaproteobacteria bacterium]
MDKNPHAFRSETPLPRRRSFVFRTPPMTCPYLDGQMESRIAVDLTGPDASDRYDYLSQTGFRRTGRFAYRPNCPDCSACVSVRVLAKDFQATRSHRRIQALNTDLQVSEQSTIATPEQFWLFRHYQLARHQNGDMASMDFSDYRAIVEEGLPETRLIEFRRPNGQLALVGLIDWLRDGPSAVYSFFEPGETRRSLGSFLILWLIEQARRRELPHVYLGYWIAECRKMTYKTRFQPLEGYGRDGWYALDL